LLQPAAVQDACSAKSQVESLYAAARCPRITVTLKH
jgi:hypothetical protein